MPVQSHERLTRQLREGVKGGVYFLFGEEDHLRQAATRDIVEAHLDPGTRDFNLDEVRGTDVAPETLASLIATPPMMSEWRVVVVRDAQALAVSSTTRAILDDVATRPPPGLALVLLADLGDSQAKIWGELKKKTTAVGFARLSDADLPGWLMGWARERGLSLEVDAARAIGVAIGPDLAAAVREMEKLTDYVGDRKTITREDVVAVVGAIPRQDRWEWMDMVGERRIEQARKALPVLLDTGDTGVGLVIGLANQFVRIGLFLAGGRNALDRHLPNNQKWLARKVEPQARHWRADEVDRVLDHLRRADRLLKSAPLTQLQVMEELLLRMQHEGAAAA
jgi:DNA polymerase III subunit delta